MIQIEDIGYTEPSLRAPCSDCRFRGDHHEGLRDAVARAGVRAKLETDDGVPNGVAEFLSRFALTINSELRNPQQREANQYDYWDALRKTWMAEVESLREAFGIAPSETGGSTSAASSP
jgi:hypothetical protein